jgi:FAD/FMN-containing dehydrogenase
LSITGGISYFSPRKGFACDNVKNFEIVLFSGLKVNANAKDHSDLWLALRGGSNNFGIVTRYDLITVPYQNMWGGMILYADDASPTLLSAFHTLNTNYDEYAALILSFSYVSGAGYFVSANLEYTKAQANPPSLRPFTEAGPQLTNTMRISTVTDLTTEFVALQPNGRRQLYITSSFRSDLAMLQAAYAQMKSITASLPILPGASLSLTIQPIPTNLIAKSAPLGGNVLGLTPSEGPLVLVLVSATWDDPASDATFEAAAKSLHEYIVGTAKEKGVYNEWEYLNYAAAWQDPISGYGDPNKQFLQRTSQKYDPTGVFQKLVPGGFKLFR